MLSCIPLEQLTGCPFNCEEVHAGVRFSDLDRTYYVRMFDAGAVLSFSDESDNGSTVEAKLFPQNFECYGTVRLMRRSIDRRSPAFANLTLDSVPGYL